MKNSRRNRAILDKKRAQAAKYAAPKPFKVCPPAIRHGQDQLLCTLCHRVWDTDEQRPACGVPQ